MLRRVFAASALCTLFVWRSAAAPNGEARKIKLAEGLRAKAAGARAAALAAGTRLPPFAPDGGYDKSLEQDGWGRPVQKQWDGKNSYWKKTDDVDLAFMEPSLAPASSWAARRDLPLAAAGRFAVSSAAGKTCILFGGVGTGPYADTGVVCYAEDREGASWKVSEVGDSRGFKAKRVFDLCWFPTSTSGYICAATRMPNVSTPKTPLFYRGGVVPSSYWVSAPEQSSPLIPPRGLYAFTAISPGAAGTNPEVYLGTVPGAGAAKVYHFNYPRNWELLGSAGLPRAKGVYSLCTVPTGVLAGTGPNGLVYEWDKNRKKWEERRVGQLTAGVIYDLAPVGDYVYAALGNCSPEPKARLFRAKDNYAQWADVTPKGSAAGALKAFVAVDAFGKDGAVAALGDSFGQIFVAHSPEAGGWGLVKGDGGSGKDLARVASGTDFWGNFVACVSGGVYARKFQGFKKDGVLYSSVFDSHDKLVEYKKLEFEGPLASGGAKFWLRAARDYDAFKTPGGSQTGEPAWLEAPPGQPLPAELDNKRFVQYKVRLDVPEGLKFPPVLKRVRLAMLSPYGKVVETYPPNRAEKQAAEVPITFWFSKGVRPETIKKENVVIRGKRRQYNWPRYIYRKDNFEFTVYHDVFEADDAITVTLESTPGRRILDSRGKEIDPDGDGEPGGRYKFSFTVGSGGGPVISEPFRGEREGPIVYDVKVEPNPTYGETEVRITATADDTKRGNSNIAAAEFSVGREPAPPGQGEPMEGEFKSPKVTVFAETDIGGQPRRETRLIVYVRAQDAFANWGDATAAPIFILPPEFLPKEYVYFYPNPCREDMGYFHFLVTRDSDVNVCIYDMRGRLVGEIGSYAQAYSGERGLPWDVSGIGADVYFFTLTARAVATGEVASVTKKLAVLK